MLVVQNVGEPEGLSDGPPHNHPDGRSYGHFDADGHPDGQSDCESNV